MKPSPPATDRRASVTGDARSGDPSAVVATVRVSGLWIYPVKSLGGVAVDAAEVGEFGLAVGDVGDRRHAIVDGAGRVITQREHARLAPARVTLGGAGAGAMTVHAPGQPPLVVTTPKPDAPRRAVRIFDDVTEGAAHPAHVDAWFSAWLGISCHLVHMPDDVRRPVDPRYAGPEDRAAYADGYPVLVASQRSLDALNARLTAAGNAPVGIERFRPNVLVDGEVAPFAEDGWRALRVGDAPGDMPNDCLGEVPNGVALALVKPCARCVVTTIDQATAERGVEPLRTLAGFRRAGSKVLFAQNAVVRASGRVRLGDPVCAFR